MAESLYVGQVSLTFFGWFDVLAVFDKCYAGENVCLFSVLIYLFQKVFSSAEQSYKVESNEIQWNF